MQQNADSESAEICRRVRSRAAECKMTALELSRKTKLSYRIIHDILHERARPRDVTIGKIAETLGTTYDALAGHVKTEYPERGERLMTSREQNKTPEPAAANTLTVREAIHVLSVQLEIDERRLLRIVLDAAGDEGEAGK